MSETYKRFFKIEGQHSELIERYFKLRDSAIDKLSAFSVRHAIRDVYYSGTHVSFVTFNGSPDMAVWKKASDGFMPRAKQKALCSEIVDIKRPCSRGLVIKEIFGSQMQFILTGKPKPKGGIPMYSAEFYGTKNGYFIQLPWTDEKPDRYSSYLNKPIPNGLTEVKEWEVLKSIDEVKLENNSKDNK